MNCRIVSALNKDKGFSTASEIELLKKTMHSICACLSLSTKLFPHRQTDWVCVGENVKTFP